MKISEKKDNRSAVLTIEGKLMGDPDTPKVHEYVKRLTGAGIREIVIDLKPLVWLNSAGLGTLIASLITVRRSGGELVLANVHGKAEEVICMTHLNKVFSKYDSVDQAEEALRGKFGR